MNRGFLIVILAALGLGGWMGYQYHQTGVWSVTPVELSPAERKLRDLRAELAEVEERIAAEERTTAQAGGAPSQNLRELYDRRQKLEREIAAIEAEVGRE